MRIYLASGYDDRAAQRPRQPLSRIPCPMRFARSLLVVVLLSGACAVAQRMTRDVSLDGAWQTGVGRQYTATTTVPGMAQDAAKMSPGVLWYKRTVQLPPGDWSRATLTLKGARFHPEVYVDGSSMGAQEGGMAPTVFALNSPAVAPGKTITLEIALRSQKDMEQSDASTVPGADLWRNDVSSGLWDDVELHLSGKARLSHATPFTDFAHRTLAVHWKAEGIDSGTVVRAEVVDLQGAVLAHAEAPARGANGVVTMPLPATLQAWSPEHPVLERLRLTLLDGGHVEDVSESSWALKHFESRDKRFYLNGEPVEMLGGTVVWHRFVRMPGAAEVAWDTAWFDENITSRLKSYGANTLRWHLGLPPERLLDLCDREGLMVQLEWPFFHGIAASVPSMETQWAAWLDVAMRHPSVMIVHPWNEVGGPVSNGWEAINAVLPNYPPLVVAHRDTVHIHKYWWSLFENLGLYYDSVDQFDKTAMVDEFGGNYLDFNGDPGGYPSTRESFLRFLGRDATRGDRLELHAESNARVAEYWRRIGAPGILPFCILGSLQDGNSWFLGDLKHPLPMPVWDELAAAFSPVSVSLDVWDRNYTPGARIRVPLYLFNDSHDAAELRVEVRVVDTSSGAVLSRQALTQTLAPHEHAHQPVELSLPQSVGEFRFEAVLLNPPAGVKHPVVSAWNVRTVAPKLPSSLTQARIGIAPGETELRAFLKQNGITAVGWDDPQADVILGSLATWKVVSESSQRRQMLAAQMHRGASIVLLDIGPRDLGEGYRKTLGNLEGAPTVRDPYVVNAELFDGVHLAFHQVAEPESHIQPAAEDRDLWAGLPIPSTWIWNGLRGGLIAPAADMEVTGMSQQALLAQWKEHGADVTAIASGGSYYAYQFFGYYAFSTKPQDKTTQDSLRARVRLLAEDAPALKDAINPNGPIEEVDLGAAYRAAANSRAHSLVALSTCGKNLTRAEIVKLSFGTGEGSLVLSQALTAGRLVRGGGEAGLYGLRYDPAAEQFTLNMIAEALERPKTR
jgi:beta-galactosidase